MNKWMKSRGWEDNYDVWLLFRCHYSLPQGLGDVTTFPDLIAELLKRGYSDEEVKKVVGENLIRAFKKAEEVCRWVKCFSSLRANSPGRFGGVAGKRRSASNYVRLWNLNICIEKCGDDVRNDVITLGECASMFVYIRADWRKSDSSVDGEPQGNMEAEFKFQRSSCKLSFLFSPRRQSAPES